MGPQAQHARVGTRFGPYEIRGVLGRGGMGEVYEAYDTVKDRTVALKLLPEEMAQDPSYQERFRRESHRAARLQEPHVIPIHDWGQIGDVLYIDMRLVQGQNLRGLISTEGPLAPERAVGIVTQIASALDAAHADGLVHRDVKPENVLVTPDDFAYLVDFGIAYSASDSELTARGATIGSLAYMAPERFDDVPITARADIYSLACVLHVCVTGSTPYPAGTLSALLQAHRTQPHPKPSRVNPAVPAALDAVIAKGLSRNPSGRHASAGEFARAAKAALGAPPAPASTPAPAAPAPAPQAERTTFNPVAFAPTTHLPPTPRRVSEPTGRAPRPDPTMFNPGAVQQHSAGTPHPGAPHSSAPQHPAAPQLAPYASAPAAPPTVPPEQWHGPQFPQAAPPPRRRNWLPIAAVIVFVVCIAAAAVIGWQVLAADDTPGGGSTSQAAPPSGAPKQPPSPKPSPTPGAVALPQGAQPCAPVHPPAGAFSKSAVGNTVTSCPFAEEVRLAYGNSGAPGQLPRPITATSPVTGQSYTMQCSAVGQLVTCSGGNDALVYVY